MFLGEKTFLIYKQLNAPLKVTSEQKHEKTESSVETENRIMCIA